MHTDNIVLISPAELESLIRNVVREEISAAGNQRKEKELMNAKQLCKFLGIHISTLNKWKAEGTIKYKRLGKRIFFNREEVLSSLKEDGIYNKLKVLNDEH